MGKPNWPLIGALLFCLVCWAAMGAAFVYVGGRP